MRMSKVPVDMSSEQKEILGILSKRHLMYLGVGVALLYAYIPPLFKLLFPIGIVPAIIICMILAMPVVFVVIFFGFMKVEKLSMNRDYYYYIKFTKKMQYGSWRKGS